MSLFKSDKIVFQVQGSSADPYTVTFYKKGRNFSAICTCQAGQNGMYCKHRFGIMNGDPSNITSQNTNQVKTIQEWLIGTDVEQAMEEVALAEKKAADAKKELTKAKKNLAKSMYD